MKLPAMYKLFVVLFVAASLASCEEYQDSPVLEASVLVYDTVYVPEGHGSDIIVTSDIDGNFGITEVNVDMPERFAAVLLLNDSKIFIANSPLAEKIYKNFNRGETALLVYKDRFLVIKDKSAAEVVEHHTFEEVIPIDLKKSNKGVVDKP